MGESCALLIIIPHKNGTLWCVAIRLSANLAHSSHRILSSLHFSMLALCTAATTAFMAPAAPAVRHMAPSTFIDVRAIDMAPPPGFEWATFEDEATAEVAPASAEVMTVEQGAS